MARMNKRNRDKTLAWFRTRTGYYNKSTGSYLCQECGAPFPEKQICVDHRDNDNTNNHRRNLQPLCRSCNTIKNIKDPMKKRNPSRPSIKQFVPETIKRSDRIRRATVKYLSMIKPGDRVHMKDAIEHISFEAKAGQDAVQRAIEVQTGAHPDCRYMRFAEMDLDDDDNECQNVFIKLKPEYDKA